LTDLGFVKESWKLLLLRLDPLNGRNWGEII
jgi:hypothetical protein